MRAYCTGALAVLLAASLPAAARASEDGPAPAGDGDSDPGPDAPAEAAPVRDDARATEPSAAPAAAEPPSTGGEPEATPDDDDGSRRGAVSVAFSGGLMLPRADLGETRQTGLTAGLLVGLTAQSGLGLALSAEYAPLPATGSRDDENGRESHVGAVTLAPRFTLGRGRLRGWIAAGGGVVLDHEAVENASGERDRDFNYEPVASGAVGLELHIFDSGGLMVSGRYNRSLSEPRYELITATAGLVLDF